MDKIEQLKRLIALLQTLVALLMGQLNGIQSPPQVQTTTYQQPPISITINVPEIGTATSTQVLGVPTPEPVIIPPVPKEVGWDQGSKPFGVNGIVEDESVILSGDAISFQFSANRGLYSSAKVTFIKDNAVILSFPMTLQTIGGGQTSVAQLRVSYYELGSGNWQWQARIDSGNMYAIKNGSFTINLP